LSKIINNQAAAATQLIILSTDNFAALLLKGRSVGVSEAAHTGHDAEHVVVASIHYYLLVLGGRVGDVVGEIGEIELESGGIKAGEVAGATGLVVLGAEGE